MKSIYEIKADHERELQIKIEAHRLAEKLFLLTGVLPSIISPGRSPFAVFHPETKGEYLGILNTIKGTDNFLVQFAGKASIKTFSPYALQWTSYSETYKTEEVKVVYMSAICPIWVKLPDEVKAEIGFCEGMTDGKKHVGFGRYNRAHTLGIYNNRTTSQQKYSGDSVTMYAATKDESITLESIVKLN